MQPPVKERHKYIFRYQKPTESKFAGQPVSVFAAQRLSLRRCEEVHLCLGVEERHAGKDSRRSLCSGLRFIRSDGQLEEQQIDISVT